MKRPKYIVHVYLPKRATFEARSWSEALDKLADYWNIDDFVIKKGFEKNEWYVFDDPADAPDFMATSYPDDAPPAVISKIR